MSDSKHILYACPRCGTNSDFTVWKSVNVTINPELKSRVIDGDLFVFTCPTCHFTQDVAYPCLYHDQDARFMVWWTPTYDGETPKFDEPSMREIARVLNRYHLRLVPSLNRLREKVYIFDNNLDDRAIEILKRYLWSAYLERQGVQRDWIYFSDVGNEVDYPTIEFDILIPGQAQRTIRASGKNAYPRALELMREDFGVPIHEQTSWRVVDHTYWDLAESGRG